MEIFPERLRRVWSKNELRISILISLFLQIYLIVMGSRRKCSRAALLNGTLWLAYLLADGIAIFALGVLSNMQRDSDVKNKNKTDPNNALMGFWAPFLFLHLGGPNSITAYSLEDNELWRRHLLSLVYQVIVAAYAFIRSLSNGAFLAPACLMFIAGIIKYGERTWALCYASREHFRDAMLAQPNLSAIMCSSWKSMTPICMLVYLQKSTSNKLIQRQTCHWTPPRRTLMMKKF